jgi:tetratricopeptide (TPR) repeat protein
LARADSRNRFEEIIALVNAGDAAGAESLCRGCIARDPRDVNMIALLGAVLAKMRRFEEAEDTLRRAIALAPTFAKPREDLAHVLLETRRPQEAVGELETATRLDPGSESAFFALGKALALTGRGKDADRAFEQSFELAPERKELAYASRHHQEGRLDEAERMYRNVLRSNPRNVDALRLLANVVARTGRAGEAERLLQKAVSIAPDFAGAHTDLGNLLREQDRFEEAIAAHRRALELEPDNPKAHFLLAGTLAPAALTYDAIAEFERTLELNPQHPGAWLGLGHALKTVGRQEEAIRAYRECARLKPDNGEIYWSLANLKTYRLSDDDVRYMQERVDSGKLRSNSEVNFLFALGKACEDRGDYEQAWKHYVAGNHKRRQEEWYDPVHTQVLNEAIMDVFNAELLKEKAGAGSTDSAPIFIVGLPRSGSTLLEQILASHTRVEGTAELPYLGRVVSSLSRNRADGINYPAAVRELDPENLQALGNDYLRMARMHRVQGRPRFIDKMPNNFPHVGLLALILPNARVIDARRHPVDACVSCYRQLFARGQPFTYDLVDIGEYYLQYQKMMDHWHAVLPDRVLTVQYEELIADFEPQVRRLLEFCDLPWEHNCLQFYDTDRPVRTASSQQVRRPISSTAVGRWRNYEAHLGDLLEVLAPILPRYAHLSRSEHEQ